MKKVLTIAGSDCSGGAGIQADLKTFSAHGVFGMSVIVAVVAENTMRVIDIQDISADIIKKQIDAVFEDIGADAVKIGMLSQIECMLAVAEKLKEYKPEKVVVDPVMYAKGGAALMNPDAVDTLIKEVIPLAYLLTPNIPEAERITGMTIKTQDDIKKAAIAIVGMGCKNVLVKGGHTTESMAPGATADVAENSAPNADSKECAENTTAIKTTSNEAANMSSTSVMANTSNVSSTESAANVLSTSNASSRAADILYDGKKFYVFESERINTKNTHGTGCTLSSAIASNLALGYELPEAVKKAKEYITTAIRHSLEIGKGHGPTNHFYELYKKGGLI